MLRLRRPVPKMVGASLFQVDTSTNVNDQPPPTATASRTVVRVVQWLAVALLVVFALRHWRNGPLAESDDYAQYFLHARALLHGRAYWDTGYLYNPQAAWVGPLNYP